MTHAPAGLPERLWVVVRSTGERYYVDKPIEGGIEAWAKGQHITVAEYTFARVAHAPPVKDQVPPKG